MIVRYFQFYVRTEQDDIGQKLSTFVNHLKQQTVAMILTTTNISPLRVPMVEVEFNDRGFTLEVMILEKMPVSRESLNSCYNLSLFSLINSDLR